MSRAIKIINEIPSNKAGIKLFADAVIMGVMNGEADPLEVRARIDAIERIIKSIKEDQSFQDAVLDHADQWGEKSFEYNGLKFTKAESAKYDYSDDEIWEEIRNEELSVSQRRKSEETLLKSLQEPTEVNGVLRHPPVKRSSNYVRITF